MVSPSFHVAAHSVILKPMATQVHLGAMASLHPGSASWLAASMPRAAHPLTAGPAVMRVNAIMPFGMEAMSNDIEAMTYSMDPMSYDKGIMSFDKKGLLFGKMPMLLSKAALPFNTSLMSYGIVPLLYGIAAMTCCIAILLFDKKPLLTVMKGVPCLSSRAAITGLSARTRRPEGAHALQVPWRSGRGPPLRHCSARGPPRVPPPPIGPMQAGTRGYRTASPPQGPALQGPVQNRIT